MVLPDDLLFVGTLLRHVDRHSHCTHNTSVQVIQRRLIGRKKLDTVAGLHRLFRDARLPLTHNLPLRLDACGVVKFHVPDICMAASFHLLLRLIDRLTEAIIHLLMYPVLILIPDQVRNIVDGRLKKMAGLPVILLDPALLLPSEDTESALGIRHRQRPYILELFHIFFQQRDLLLICKHNKTRLRSHPGDQCL